MNRDYTVFLWLLKLGVPLNLYFLAHALGLGSGGSDPHVVVPAAIFFAVSAYRCLLPDRYKDNVVFHVAPPSSIFVTRLLATFSEISYAYLFSHVIRTLNVEGSAVVDALSWLMVLEAVISQGFVWGAIVTGRLVLYVWEELGWFVIFVANTAASALLWNVEGGPDGGRTLLTLNLLFGLGYLPWQAMHLRSLFVDAKTRPFEAPVTRAEVRDHLHRAMHERNRRTDAESWGGVIGLTWMAGYWAFLLPPWIHWIARILG